MTLLRPLPQKGSSCGIRPASRRLCRRVGRSRFEAAAPKFGVSLMSLLVKFCCHSTTTKYIYSIFSKGCPAKRRIGQIVRRPLRHASRSQWLRSGGLSWVGCCCVHGVSLLGAWRFSSFRRLWPTPAFPTAWLRLTACRAAASTQKF